MNNYLLQILKETKTIIIPGLGALTVTNETTGEIMFMSFLKHDDGNLAKYISEKEGMDINDAKNLIAKYVREIQAEIDKGEKYSMYQFGSFYKLDGEVAFEQWTAGSAEDTSVTAQPPIVEETKAPIEEPKVEPIIVVEETPAPIIDDAPVEKETPTVSEIIKEEEPAIEPIVEKIPEEKIESPAPIEEKVEEIIVPPIVEKKIEVETPKEDTSVPAAKSKEPTVEKKEKIVEEKIVVPPLEEVKPIVAAQVETSKAPEPVKTKSPKEQLKAADKLKTTTKKKTGVFAYILWGFVVLILGAGTYVAVQFDTLKKDFPILAKMAGEEVEKEKDTTLLSLGENDPVANPDSMPEVETVPGEETIDAQPIVETPVEETKPEPVKKPEPPVVKPTPKPVVVKPAPKPVVTSTYTPSKPVVKAANFPTPNLGMPYHVIVGSFSSKLNARNFATKLKGMGMSNLTIGEKDGLFKVSVNGYSTEEEAKAALPSLKAIAPTAWVFNWK